MTTPSSARRRFAFISSNTVPWGGSEELWGATAAVLAEQGHSVAVLKGRIERDQPRIRRLRELGCALYDLIRVPLLPARVSSALSRFAYPVIAALKIAKFTIAFRRLRPELAIVSQGGNYDGLMLASLCRRAGVPYVLIAQKATEMYWPPDTRLAELRDVYASARACYFVSGHNWRLTEEQVGMRLPHGRVVRNPFLVRWTAQPEWPARSEGLDLACVGRLYPTEKGQDLLLRVLSRERWRARPLTVTFYGGGPHREALEQMAAHLGLTSVRFAGFTEDVEGIWRRHHGVVIPSRCEGLPLVLVEAMLCSRVAVATDVAGHGEVITDGVTGFLASSAAEDPLDDALERAWQRKDEWPQIGAAAAARIRMLVPENPAAEMAAILLDETARLDVEPVDARVESASSAASLFSMLFR